MIYLIFAILFSASLALALRISETFSDNRYGILVGNYVTCLVVAFILLPDKNIFAAGSRTAVLTGIVNGFLFTGNLVLMQKCIRENGAVLSSAFAKLGIVIPVTASILFLGEIPTLFQLVGIVLVIVAIWVINSEGTAAADADGGWVRRDFCSFYCRQRYGRRDVQGNGEDRRETV